MMVPTRPRLFATLEGHGPDGLMTISPATPFCDPGGARPGWAHDDLAGRVGVPG